MDTKVDLHIHTYISDGEWSGKDIIKYIDEKDIKMFAVCDHDDTGCVKEVSELVADRPDLTYVKGVEISTQYKGREIHILTYNIGEDNKTLQEILAYNRRVRDDYNDGLIRFLGDKYPQVTLEDYYAYDYYPYQGGWYTYCYMMDKGIISNLGDYFDVIKGYQMDKTFIEPDVLLKKLNEENFVPILAHPPAYADGDIWSEADLDYFRALGIHGIECYTQYLEDQNNASYYVDYCDRHNLKITGGSDCHGGFAGRKLGHPNVTKSMIRF